ncbi:cell division protein ZapA [Siphonobacter aquaeclarae]|jgi:cell division protein ZapA (FtsZ GTPase activity inhibitor)|uniref:Cell division protein ZapA n=1 Tax=Siphonobacter aquaeclarae TaxID=563176 RepID=A0A1G9Q6K2_9BACT|nr:cell division protein ZapA [Siphonobacter aquaeclarae]MBO9639490.1 cell division protein ZapA [Siphonobacter aquaeclarae]SDM05975.1 Cell division protein ZapA [Siphonobacter aquaeclarae]
MGTTRTIHIQLAGTQYEMTIPKEDELYVREAARILNERMQQLLEKENVHSMHERMTRVMLFCMVSNLKLNAIQHQAFAQLELMDDLITPAIRN